ncbi:3'-5' exonuclease [Austwickia chelonae]|nr:3'-5' exonuclease [Austwickia chelonae]
MTTGFSAARERVIEVAVAHCDRSGRVQEVWSSLVDPQRAEVSGAAVHGLWPGVLQGAPSFAQIAPEVLSRLEGRVAVALGAELVEAFLAAELLRAGVLTAPVPAVDVGRWAAVSGAASGRWAAVARLAGRGRSVPSSAVEDVRLLAAVLPRLWASFGTDLVFPVGPTPVSSGRHRRAVPGVVRPAAQVGAVPTGWLAELMVALPMSAAETHDARLAAYVDGLTAILPTGRIVAEEVRELTGSAVRAGFTSSQLHAVAVRLLESMRSTAFARGELSQDQVRHLRAAAVSLGVPQYFDDLVQAPAPPAPEPGSGSFSRPVRKPLPPPPPQWLPRCGHCLQVGHYTSSCPRLRRRGRGGGTPGVGPVEPIRPI